MQDHKNADVTGKGTADVVNSKNSDTTGKLPSEVCSSAILASSRIWRAINHSAIGNSQPKRKGRLLSNPWHQNPNKERASKISNSGFVLPGDRTSRNVTPAR